MKHFAIALAFLSTAALAQAPDPAVITQSAYIQLLSKLDGTQEDLEIPGVEDVGKSIWNLAENSDQELVSHWISDGLSPDSLAHSLSCIDQPGDFQMEDHVDFWRFRDSRELACTSSGIGFSIGVEVVVNNADGGQWESTTFQSVRSVK